MKTDNSNIVVYEKLIEAADKEYYEHFIAGFELVYQNGAIFGADWRKEQLQPLIDSHAELLEALKDLFYSANYENIEPSYKGIIPFYVGKKGIASDESIHKAKSAIERANNLIK